MVGTCLEGLVHVFTLASNRGQDAVKQCLSAMGMSDTKHVSAVGMSDMQSMSLHSGYV